MRWSAEEDEALRSYYPERGSSWELWDMLLPNRTQLAIRSRAKHLGIRCERDMPSDHGQYVSMSAEIACAALNEGHRERLRHLIGRAFNEGSSET